LGVVARGSAHRNEQKEMNDRDQYPMLGNDRQLELLECQVDETGLPPEVYELVESPGRFTGERIFSGDSRLYQAIVALLAERFPTAKSARYVV
jgi:hypothetical protein